LAECHQVELQYRYAECKDLVHLVYPVSEIPS
jgi:hypothetical protein